MHLDRTLHLIAAHGCKPGVVINPATPVEMLDEVLEIVHHVLVMSVNPGFGGQEFIRGSLRKMEALAKTRAVRGLNFRIEVDGGVALDTIADVVRAGRGIAGGGECGVWRREYCGKCEEAFAGGEGRESHARLID